MTTPERIRVFIFLLLVVGVYVAAAGIIFRWVWRRIRRRPAPRRRLWRRAAGSVVLVLAAVGIVCMLYGRFVEPYWLDVSRVELVSEKLPPGSGPIRLVHISDLHSDPDPRLEDDLPGVIAGLEPDAIVFTGDATNSPAGAPVFRRCMSRLAEIAPTFAVRGNFDRSAAPFEGTGVELLESESRTLDIHGAMVRLIGVPAGQDPAAAIDNRPGDRAYTVFLHHYPGGIVRAAGRVDLYLAGHTHGGQVALPFYGAMITMARHGKRFEAGLYNWGGTDMYVSRGMGMEGDPAPRVRFFARPEVTLIEIHPPETPRQTEGADGE